MNETLHPDKQGLLLTQLDDAKKDEDLSTIEGVQQFLHRLLSELAQGCNFAHTKKRGKQCEDKPFSCLHYTDDDPGTAIASLLKLNIIDFTDFHSLRTKYRDIYSDYYGMDVRLHNASETTERNTLIKIALETRGLMAKFIKDLLVICEKGGIVQEDRYESS